jgi:hypothetical protein
MPDLVQAARQLIAQVHELHPKAKIAVLDEVDGLGFQRSIRLSGEPAKRITPALEAMRDPRIAEIVKSSAGTRVTFVSDTRADHRDAFPLVEVLAVLED